SSPAPQKVQRRRCHTIRRAYSFDPLLKPVTFAAPDGLNYSSKGKFSLFQPPSATPKRQDNQHLRRRYAHAVGSSALSNLLSPGKAATPCAVRRPFSGVAPNRATA